MRGECLCGQVKFEVLGKLPRLYQCHCSLCRKQSGTASNAATIVAAANFCWRAGVEHISSWVKDTGYRSDFCSRCGSPAPNPLGNARYFWVPAGLLDVSAELEIGAHFWVSSKAGWATISSGGVRFETIPDLAALLELLHSG